MYGSLNELALHHGYLEQPASRGYRLGVNARYSDPFVELGLCSIVLFAHSDWLRGACATIRSNSQAQLRSLFNQLARLLSTLTNAVFVFDSQLIQDAKPVVPQHMLDSFQSLINVFGFHVHTVCQFGTLPSRKYSSYLTP